MVFTQETTKCQYSLIPGFHRAGRNVGVDSGRHGFDGHRFRSDGLGFGFGFGFGFGRAHDLRGFRFRFRQVHYGDNGGTAVGVFGPFVVVAVLLGSLPNQSTPLPRSSTTVPAGSIFIFLFY